MMSYVLNTQFSKVLILKISITKIDAILSPNPKKVCMEWNCRILMISVKLEYVRSNYIQISLIYFKILQSEFSVYQNANHQYTGIIASMTDMSITSYLISTDYIKIHSIQLLVPW